MREFKDSIPLFADLKNDALRDRCVCGGGIYSQCWCWGVGGGGGVGLWVGEVGVCAKVLVLCAYL